MSKNPVPTRMCLSCMTRRPKVELIRIVRSTDGKAIIDTENRLSGRGAYICSNLSCVQIARKKDRFSKALKGEVASMIYDELAAFVSGGTMV